MQAIYTEDGLPDTYAGLSGRSTSNCGRRYFWFFRLRSIYHKEFLSIPSCLQTAEIVPAFKSFWPQSGIVVPLSVAGFKHFRCDPPPRRTISRHPIARSFLVNSL